MQRLLILGRILAWFPGLCILVVANVSAVESPGPKRFLMLFSEGKDLPVNVIAEQAAKTELQSQLRESGGSLVPIILVTAHDEPDVRRETEQSGYVAYLRKPVASRILLEAIAKALNPGATPTAS